MAHLALVTHWQSGGAEGGDYDYYRSNSCRRRYSRWSSEKDEEEADETSSQSGYEMGDVFDEGLSANHWSGRDGQEIHLGEIDLDQEEIVAPQPLEDWTISREEFEGYTGNAGMTLERWNHRAAVVIWPQRDHFQVLCSAGTDAAIVGLEAMVRKRKRFRKSEQDEQRSSCLEFADAIIDAWTPQRFRSSWRHDQDSIDRSTFVVMLQELDAPDLVCRFLAQVMPQDVGVQLHESFPAFCRRHGWKSFESSLVAVIDSSSTATILRNACWLEILCLERKNDPDRTELCRRLAKHIVAALTRIDRRRPKRRSPDDALDNWQDDNRPTQPIGRPALLTALVKSLVAVEAEKSLARLIDHTLALSAKYELNDVHLKTIFGLQAWLTRKSYKPNPAVSRWLEHCRAALEQRTAAAPQPPTDYRRAAKLSCDCDDCRELSRFLADLRQSVHKFSVAQNRRRHLHQIIDDNACDLNHITTRKGRPFTLVCTKTTASYEAACQVYSRDLENLKRLQSIQEAIER